MTTPDGPVPGWLRTASDWSWRLIVIVVASWMVVVAAIELGLIVGPVLVAAMICALLEPIRRRLLRRGLSANASWIVAFVIGFACVSGVLALVVSEFYDSYDELAAQARDGVSEVTDWLETGPLKVDATGVDSAMDRALNSLRDDPAEALAGTFSVLSTTTGLLAGGLLTFVTTLFFMKDRAVMWGAVLRMTPAPQRDRVDRAGRAAWHALIAYVKVTLTSAVVDSLAIGIASAIAGLPVAFALGALVFLFEQFENALAEFAIRSPFGVLPCNLKIGFGQSHFDIRNNAVKGRPVFIHFAQELQMLARALRNKF